jgi:DNA-binding CsgD family transcriptional regulator
MEELTLRDTQKLLEGIHSLHCLKNPQTFVQDVLVLLEQLVPVSASCAVIDQQVNYADMLAILEQEVPPEESCTLTVEQVNILSEGTIHSPESGFARLLTERDRLILNLLQPHINQAYQSVRNFHWLSQQIEGLKEMFDCASAILLDELGYIQQMSAQAACWLYDYCPTTYYSRQLPEPLYTWFINQLTQLNSQVNNLSSSLPLALPLRIKQENRQLTIRFNASLKRRQYILLLTEEQSISLETAFELLGLTPREAEVLFWTTQGQDNKAIASQLNISVSTVRKHLENIYLKLQVSSRTEAVTRALEKVGLLN